MHKLVLKIKNNKNYKMFLDMLEHIDFVELEEKTISSPKSGQSLNKLYGMWKDRNIDLQKIRDKAWRL